MIDWKYNPEDYNPGEFELIPVGDYRVRIDECEQKLSKTGKPMFQLILSVSGHVARIWYWLLFDNSSEQMSQVTNSKLGSIYDSFDIPKGNLNPFDWKGKVGGAKIRHKMFNEEKRAEVQYFLSRKKVDTLPAWHEKRGAKKSSQYTSMPPITAETFQSDINFA